MGKVTSKLQVTLPKALAERFGIFPGDEIKWEAAGDVIRVLPPRMAPPPRDLDFRLELFDQATQRQEERNRVQEHRAQPEERGWTREELHSRGRTH